MVDESADRLAALRQHPEVAKALRNVLDAYTSACANAFYKIETDALLSAVAAAATAQTVTDADALAWAIDGLDAYAVCFRGDCSAKERARCVACQADEALRLRAVALLRALAGGAPPATQTTDTTEE